MISPSVNKTYEKTLDDGCCQRVVTSFVAVASPELPLAFKLIVESNGRVMPELFCAESWMFVKNTDEFLAEIFTRKPIGGVPMRIGSFEASV